MRAINYKTSYEDIITRIPGLFAYVEKGEIHIATDSPMGCYGKIVENLKINIKDDLNINGKIILKNGNTYSFKTLINLYYKYKDIEFNENNEIIDQKGNVVIGFDSFKKFIENGIGKISVNIEKTEEMDLVPEYVYLVETERLYNEMYDLSVICKLYKTHMENKTEIDKETESEMCCKCLEYNRRGGDEMLKFLLTLITERDKRATEYYNYCKNKENSLTINYGINLFSSDRDLGVVTPTDALDNQIKKCIIPYEVKDKDGNVIETKNYFEQTFNTNSKLKSLRKRQKYYNAFDEIETPDSTKDWLYYYRVGYITNVTVLNDELGNIQTEETDIANIEKGETVNDLYAYGDVIDKIELSKRTLMGDEYVESEEDSDFDKTPNAFKITYWTDIHLKAECKEVKIDDDGNRLVCFNEFKYKEDDNENDFWYMTGNNNIDVDCLAINEEECNYHGIKYEEIYTFDEDSEIVDLINEGKFDDYVNGKLDVDSEDAQNELKLFEKYEFSLYNNITTRKKDLSNTSVEFNDLAVTGTIRITQYEERLDTESNKGIETFEKDDKKNIILEPNAIIRHEFYEGITYTPTEEFNVYIDRGVTSIFDKHIRFSEIHTMNDMEEFNNGSYFSLQE